MIEHIGDDAVELIEEKAIVQKHDVATGQVRISTRTENVDQNLEVELEQDSVEVVHVPKNETVVGQLPQIRTEGEVTIIPILEEIVVIEKRLMLKEELHIHRRRGTEKLDIPISLKRQTAEIVRTATKEAAD